MIKDNFSIQGKGHIERGIKCQDASMVECISSGHYLGIVADGVGSAPFADVGSTMAVNGLFKYCDEHITKDSSFDDIQDVLSEGYTEALEQIDQYIRERGAGEGDCDTTLSAVIYDGETVVFCHAGDGGILVKYTDGRIEAITTRQKGEDGVSVRPLRAGKDSWDSGVVHDAVSVMLVTDGMLDGVFQPVLVNLPPDREILATGNFKKDQVYITAAEFFMNPNAVYQNEKIKKIEVKNNEDKPEHVFMDTFLQGDLTEEDEADFKQCILAAYEKMMAKEELEMVMESIESHYYMVWAVANIKDDKSVVLLMNEKSDVQSQPVQYYKDPNWVWRQECYDALLYGRPMPEIPPDDPLFTEDKIEINTQDDKISEERLDQRENFEINGEELIQKEDSNNGIWRKVLPWLLKKRHGDGD